MPLRKIRNADDAVRCLDAWSASGEPRAVWARRHGIDPRSLNIWRVNLERCGGERPASDGRLLELVPARSMERGASYRVHCGGVVAEVGDEFDDGVLRRLLTVAASC